MIILNERKSYKVNSRLHTFVAASGISLFSEYSALEQSGVGSVGMMTM